MRNYGEASPVAICMFTCVLLAGCGGGLKDPGLRYYKALGSVQCDNGGTSAAQLEHDLVTAGITVARTSCGQDGMLRSAVCGAPDGRIAIFEIAPSQATAASALGLQPLSTLPDAVEVPCKGPVKK